jgi:hypothetical protein
VKNIQIASVMVQPLGDELFARILIKHRIDIVLVQGLGGCRSTAIPDDTSRINLGDKKCELVVLYVVSHMTVGFVAPACGSAYSSQMWIASSILTRSCSRNIVAAEMAQACRYLRCFVPLRQAGRSSHWTLQTVRREDETLLWRAVSLFPSVRFSTTSRWRIV